MNGGDPVPDSDLERARELALRHRCKFVNLHDFQVAIGTSSGRFR